MKAICILATLSMWVVLAPPPGQAQESYELPTYTDAQRWNRAATLLTAVMVGNIRSGKEAGMTAEEGGRAGARVFGPPHGWNGADTPMRLFRGMYRNWMSHPDQRCDVLEAGERLVRARCSRPYAAFFGDEGASYGVTLREYEEHGMAFGSAIADHHGMDWEQSVEGGDLLITIRKR